MEQVPTGTGAGFVGRRQEVGALLQAWDEARQGATRVLGVAGGPGIGKTALVRRFLQQARPDTVICVSGDEVEATLSWALGSQLTADLPGGEGVSQQPETALSAAAALEAGLRGVGRAVVVVDDAHWADPLSMTALRVAVRRLTADPVLILLVYQSAGGTADVLAGTPSPGLDGAWRRIFESERGGHLSIAGLPAIDLVRLAVACGHPGLTPHGAARLHEHTGGHPMHVRHL
ncbi:MAG TPA: ATP-binding protein, partial [Actinoplanes sp.]|nr:ATP-binding protein [Actinoplanes sp.]